MFFSNRDCEPKCIGKIERHLKEIAKEQDGAITYVGVGNLKQVANVDHQCQIHLAIPARVVNNPMLYGKAFTTKIAKNVFGVGWENHSFMIAPGNFQFKGGELYFEGTICPGTTSTILVVADMPMWAYGGVNGLNTFEIGAGAYGLLLPFARLTSSRGIFAGRSLPEVIGEMRHNMATAFAAIA